MRKDKSRAISLRKEGKSYAEIKVILNVPKSTLSDWLRETGWSQKIKLELSQKNRKTSSVRLKELNKIYKRNLNRVYKEAREEAKKEFETLKFHPLFISGISLYWGEGDKSTRHNLRLANTDPLMIKLFVKFILKVCGVKKEKIRAYVLIYPDLNAENCKKYWVKKSGLSCNNFNSCVKIAGRHKTKRLPYGVCYISVSSTYLKEKMKVWLNLFPKEFINNKYYKKEYYAGVV